MFTFIIFHPNFCHSYSLMLEDLDRIEISIMLDHPIIHHTVDRGGVIPILSHYASFFKKHQSNIMKRWRWRALFLSIGHENLMH